jgi:predicted secreted protein
MLVRDAASDAHNELAVESGWHDDDDYRRRIDALLAATAAENRRLARRERWEAGYATRDAASGLAALRNQHIRCSPFESSPNSSA